MAQQFAKQTLIQNGGISYEQWVKKVITPEYLTGDDIVSAYMQDGTRKDIMIKDAAVLYVNFKQFGTSISAEPLFQDNEIVIFDITELYLAHGRVKEHPLFKSQYSAIIPLGIPAKTENNYAYQQSGRLWLSKGANNVNMSDDNVAVSLFNCLSSTTYQMVSCKEEDKMKSLFNLIIMLVKNLMIFNKNNTTIKNIIKQLRNTETSQDMLQYGLSFLFGKKQLTRYIQLNMFEVVLKRTYKHTPNLYTKNGDNHPIFGILATMVIVPLYYKFFTKQIEESQMYVDYYSKFLEILGTIEEVKTLEVSDNIKDSKIIKTLVDIQELSLDNSEIAQIVDFCKKNSKTKERVPFVEWGILPKNDAKFTVTSDKIFVDNDKNKNIETEHVNIIVKDQNNIKVVSTATTEWSAINIRDNGTYTLKCKVLGVASNAKGNTAGMGQVANMRFTFGNYVLPTDREGYAISGKHFRTDTANKWIYADKTPISLNSNIVLINTTNKLEIYTTQTLYGKVVDKLVVTMVRKYAAEPVVIAFKNIKFAVGFSESVKKEEIKGEVKMTPSALL